MHDTHFIKKGICFFSAFLFVLLILFEPVSAGILNDVGFRADHMVLESVTDGKRVFAATQDGKINCFDLDKQQKLPTLIELSPINEESFPPPIFSLDLSPSKKLLASGDAKGQILLFSLESEKLIKTIEFKTIENIPALRFVNESDLLVGLMDGSIMLINRFTGDQKYRVQIELDPINGIQLSNNRKTAVITTMASVIKVIDIKDGKILHELDGHTDTTFAATFVGDEKILSGSKDKKLFLWDLISNKKELLFSSDFYINAVAWNGANRIAFHLPDYKIGIYNLSSRRLETQLNGHTAFINTMYFITPDRLMSSGNDARVLVQRINRE